MISVLQNSDSFTNVLPSILFVKSAILPKYVHLPFVLFKSEFPVCKLNKVYLYIVSYLIVLCVFLYTTCKHINSPLIIEPAGA